MRYSKWMQENMEKAGTYESKSKETLSMTERENAIQALRDVAARNNGEPTEAERRQHAVNVLAKKTPEKQPARKQANHPASQALVDAIRKGK